MRARRMVIFTIGALLGGSTVAVLLFAMQMPVLSQARGEDSSLGLLPAAVARTCSTALISPLEQAEHEIWDKDVARYYHQLLGQLGLGNDPAEAASPETLPCEKGG